MKNIIVLTILVFVNSNLSAQYNNLWIPPTLTGTTFNLEMKEGVYFVQVTDGKTKQVMTQKFIKH